MPSEQLRAELEQLQQLLSGASEIDDATRQALQKLAADIQQVLGADSPTRDAEGDLRQRIDELVVGFESRHPQLTQLLSRMTDLLANMGI